MLRPAFVITVAAVAQLAACDRETVTENPPPPQWATSGTATALAPAASSSALHDNPPAVLTADPTKTKRVVRAPLPKTLPYGKLAPAGIAINPRSEGRTIYARADGHCYVKVPPNPAAPKPKSKHPPQPVALVNCPDAMQDPAWDTCLDGRMRKLGDDDCLCRIDGNPPPPPWRADCPKK